MFLVSVLLLTGVASSEPARGTAAAGRAPYLFHTRLDNGLSVVIERRTRAPLVAVVVDYGVGAAHDPSGHAGLAHLVEHLSFRGSRHLPGRGFFEQLERVGSTRYNGVTSRDSTTYHAVVPAEYFRVPLWIESERMGFTLEHFNQRNLELEQARVRKELLQRSRSEPRFSLFLNQAIYPEGHPYRDSLAEIDDVAAVSLQDASWFFQTYYRPDNARLVIVGDIDPNQAMSAVRRYFEPIQNPPGPLPKALVPPSPRLSRRERLVVRSPVYVADRVAMVFPGAPRASADEVAHSLLTLWLRQSGAGTLSHALIDDQLLAEWVDAELMRGALSSELLVSVQARAGVKLERVEQAIDAYIARVPMLLDAATVARLGRRKLAELVFLQEDVLERAQHHTAQLRERGSPFTLAKYAARVRGVTVQQMRAVVSRYLNAEQRLAAYHYASPAGICVDGCVEHRTDAEP